MTSEARHKLGGAAVALMCLSSVPTGHSEPIAIVAPPNSRIVEVSPAYLDVIRDLFRLSKPTSREPRFAELEAQCVCLLAGVLHESPHRTTYIFKQAETPTLAITIWRYDKDGAAIHFAPGALNDRIQGVPASTGLGVAKGSRGGLWKITWIMGAPGDRQQIELYLKSQGAVNPELEKARRYAATVDRALR